MVLFLGEDDIKKVLDMNSVIKLMEDIFRQHAEGRIVMPIRLRLDIKDHAGTLLVMPAYLQRSFAMGTKLVTVYPNNPSRGLPTIIASLVLLDPRSGSLLALMDATSITAVRTGAVSAVATKYLAREDSRILAILGAGTQAHMHALALSKVMDIRELRVFSPNPIHRRNLVDSLRLEGFEALEGRSPKETVEDADVVCTVTTSKEPVLNGSWIKAGTHLNAVGAHSEDTRELDEDVISKAVVVVDSLEVALKEAGEIVIPIRKGLINSSHIRAELGQILLGSVKGRMKREEITVFKSLGLAMEDVAVAQDVYEKVRSWGSGFEFKAK